MDAMICYLLVFLCILVFSKLLFLKGCSTSNKKNLPPSPPAIPILGHLHLLKKPLYRSLASLSQHYGPVLSLRFGSRPVLVVSSPTAAEECFTTNGITFANRPRLIAGKYIGYDYTVLGWASYGPHWRNIRRISTVEIFSTNRVHGFSFVRSEEVRSMVREPAGRANSPVTEFWKVELKSRFFGLAFNVMTRMLTGKRYYGEGVEDKEEAEKFQEIVEESFSVSGATNIGDFLPFLRWVDLQGLEKRLRRLKNRRDVFFRARVAGHRRKTKESSGVEGDEDKRKTVVDLMLGLQEVDPDYYTEDFINGMIVSLLSAGTDTSAVTMEWAMSLLLNHPEILKNAQAEIDALVKNGRLVDELDLPNLPYLQAIINETLRLYPAGPILVPHESSQDCVVNGYDVPRGTMLIVNAWAIHRNEKIWEEPAKFKPERFLEDGGAVEGCKMLPFGSGRRGCPGEALARNLVGLTMLLCCNSLSGRVGSDEVDLTEGSGLTMPKVVPLEAVCRPRTTMIGTLSFKPLPIRIFPMG